MPTTVTRDASGNVWETKTKTTGKVEVRIRYCCCCSLRVAAILIAIYTIIMYLIFLALASSSLARLMAGQPDSPTQAPAVFHADKNTDIVVYDPYFDTLGLYTEETKFNWGIRYPILIINIVIYTLVIIAAILIFVALCVNLPWLILPWIGMMCLDIFRGLISVIVIFVYSGGDIRKIAVGIFFLGLQLFHMSLVLIMIAFFQWMLAKSRGQEFPADHPDKKSVIVEGSNIYPTMPTHYGYSNYAYSTSPHIKRDASGYQPSGYATQTREPPPSRLPAIADSPTRYARDDYGARAGTSGYREYSGHSSRHQSYGRNA